MQITDEFHVKKSNKNQRKKDITIIGQFNG